MTVGLSHQDLVSYPPTSVTVVAAAEFHALLWKHRCRKCRKIFCDACSQHRIELPPAPGSVEAAAVAAAATASLGHTAAATAPGGGGDNALEEAAIAAAISAGGKKRVCARCFLEVGSRNDAACKDWVP